MQNFKRAVMAATATVLIGSGASAFAADLYGGSLKDSGGTYAPVTSGRPAMFYARGDFSYGATDFNSITEAPNYIDSGAHVEAGHMWGAGLGVYFTPNVRGDLTLDWSGRDAVTATNRYPGATVEGQRQFGVKHVVGLANLYYDFNAHGGRFNPYLGVGLGFSRNTTTAGQIAISDCPLDVNGAANCSATLSGDSKTSAAGAFMAGISTRIGDRWTVDAGYRFLYLGDASTSDVAIAHIIPAPGAPNSTAGATVRDMYEHEVRVGLRMDLR